MNHARLKQIEFDQRALAERQEELAQRVKKLREEPKKHEPQPGDVYRTLSDDIYLVLKYEAACWLPNDKEDDAVVMAAGEINSDSHKYLGNFHDVYVAKREVAEALSHKDCDGDGILNSEDGVYDDAICASREALAELGITEDLLK